MNDKYKSPIPNKLHWRNWAVDDEGILVLQNDFMMEKEQFEQE